MGSSISSVLYKHLYEYDSTNNSKKSDLLIIIIFFWAYEYMYYGPHSSPSWDFTVICPPYSLQYLNDHQCDAQVSVLILHFFISWGVWHNPDGAPPCRALPAHQPMPAGTAGLQSADSQWAGTMPLPRTGGHRRAGPSLRQLPEQPGVSRQF